METLIVKLTSAVANATGLRKLDELILKLVKNGDGTGMSSLAVACNPVGSVFTIPSGGSFYSNLAGDVNLGSSITITATTTTTLYIKISATTILHITNSSYLNSISNYTLNNTNSPSLVFDLSLFKYLLGMKNFTGSLPLVTGSLSNLSNMSLLNTISIYTSLISGDLSSLSSLTSLGQLKLSVSNVAGSLASVSGLTNLTELSLDFCSGVYGTFSHLTNLRKLITLNLKSTGISGDISSLIGITTLSTINLLNSTSAFTWSNTNTPAFTAFKGLALNSAMTNTDFTNMLVCLNKATLGISPSIYCAGNQAPTVGTDAYTAWQSLVSKGVTFTFHA